MGRGRTRVADSKASCPRNHEVCERVEPNFDQARRDGRFDEFHRRLQTEHVAGNTSAHHAEAEPADAVTARPRHQEADVDIRPCTEADGIRRHLHHMLAERGAIVQVW